MQKLNVWIFFSFILIAAPSCTKDKLPADMTECTDSFTYQEDIRPILNNSCAYSGCHITGFLQGDYTSYNSMRPQLESGIFMNRVITNRNMPPSYAPSGRPKSLTIEELEMIICWAEAGYPEQ